MTPPRRPRGLFHDLTEGVYWFLVIDVLVLLAAAPTIALWVLLSPGPLTPLLFVLAALPLLPAIAAALHACGAWREERDLEPLRQFLRGYRLTLRDSLLVGAPALLVLALLALGLSQRAPAGVDVLTILHLVLGSMALLVLVRSLSIASRFTFRTRDVLRLAAFTLLARPLTTLSLISLGILTLGIALLLGEFLLPVLASLLLFALWAAERPIVQLLGERFVRPAGSPPGDGAPADRPLEGS